MNKKYKIGLTAIIIVIILIIIFWLFMNTHSELAEGKFEIYLLENNELVISDMDIISYIKTSHVIKLTEEGAEKIQNLEVKVEGLPFVIKFNGEEIYTGSFWSSVSSISSSGIVILVDGGFIDDNWVFLSQNNSIVIQLGYPSDEFYTDDYSIDNPELFNYFKSIGKLIE